MTWEINSLSRLEKMPKLEDRIFTVRKSCSEDKVKGVPGQPLASAKKIKYVTHGSPQLSQQKPSIEIQKYL